MCPATERIKELMNTASLAPCSIDHIELTELSATEWRVRDNRIPENDALSVIGFVDRVGDRYEVMQFGERLQFLIFGSFVEAVSHFVAPAARPEVVREPVAA
jgi:hypothetical protein